MTPAIKELQLKVHEWQCSLHPTVPAAYIPMNNYTDKTANGLYNCERITHWMPILKINEK